jgi:hypothetical protein
MRQFYNFFFYFPVLEAAAFETDNMLDLANKMLLESQNVRSCVLKVACWTGQSPLGPEITSIWNNVLR